MSSTTSNGALTDLGHHLRRVLAASDPHRHCVRCEADVHPNVPHLCRDVKGRLNAYRNERRNHLRRLIGAHA